MHMSHVWKPEEELGTSPLFSPCLKQGLWFEMHMPGCQDGILGTFPSLPPAS